MRNFVPLKNSEKYMKTPYALIIMDGYGLAPASEGNAISVNGSKYVNEFLRNYPSATLGASGMSVGLPDGHTACATAKWGT